MNNIQKNITDIQTIIDKYATASNRSPASIHLMAVSKRQPVEAIQEALDGGHRLFGENKVQEAQTHWSSHRTHYQDLKLHLIGPLQTNKANDAVELFDVIETIDRPKLIKAVTKEAVKQNKPIECYIQVNTGEEPQKSGVLPQDLPMLIECARDAKLNITGLMCIPPTNEPAAIHFAFLAKLANEHNLPNLSMGMSGDFEKAIPLGATHIRVGTAIFGVRD